MHTIEAPLVFNQRYQVIRLLGEGSSGRVYEVLDRSLQTHVALKQLVHLSERRRRAFEREARILARLRHPGLPVVHDYFSDPHGPCLVMDLIGGRDLAAVVAQRGALDEREVVQIADQVLGILEYLHGQHPPVLHRAIKPHDLRLCPDGRVMLLDFGLSTDQPSAPVGQTSLNPYSRSFWYAPPELLYRRPLDGRSDLYALGATLYLLASGHAPLSTGQRAAALVATQPDPLVSPHDLNPLISPALAQVITSAMALNPPARFADATTMRHALHQTHAGQQLWNRMPPSDPAPATRLALGLVGVAFLLVLIVFVAVVMVFGLLG
ncbi:serine/threonine-protein kinase [Candidatus Oscillochloris fontis]|uniref:serine/threonine-protein kinase n=1 Tax=Candidatus Oscillochloris fontis TaxID=2496868 RepID=UPI00101D6E39|nr:serine/threonine-protein kinase [Candidatus Oscillochloris fontis]